jgi:hypothetical protein
MQIGKYEVVLSDVEGVAGLVGVLEEVLVAVGFDFANEFLIAFFLDLAVGNEGDLVDGEVIEESLVVGNEENVGGGGK